MASTDLQSGRGRHDALRGFTLVEMAVAIAVAAILVSVAVPSFTGTLARMRLEGATHNLATDLQLARFEAVQRRASVSLVTDAGGVGYTVGDGTNTIKAVTLSGVTLSPNVTITFDPLRGLANAASVTGSSTGSGGQLRIVSDVMGRVQICSPSGSFRGYPSC